MSAVPGAAAGGAAAAAAAIAQAIKAMGILVEVEPGEFQKIVERSPEPLVVLTPPTRWAKRRSYLTSYRGLAFHTKTSEELIFGGRVETIFARRIAIPG